MKIQLYQHQKVFFDKIIVALEKNKSVCAVLPTGGGKSVIIAELCNKLKGRTLVLTHRLEVMNQNSKWIPKCGTLSAKENNTRYDNKVVFSMVQTLLSRIKNYGTSYLGSFDNIILDEIHVLIFEKVFSKYNYKKLIGFTGTPILNKKLITNIDGVEYIEPYTLSLIFDTIVQGPDSQELIDLGYLVQDYNIVLDLPNIDKLRSSSKSSDGYTIQSLDAVYNNTASLEVLSNAYTDFCQGKKTIIFNANTNVNTLVYNHFKEKGTNVMMYDSINDAEINPETGDKWTRDEVIVWFKNQKDALLINTNVFTTGFDVDDIEVVVMNRATTSLSLWIQCVGRGSRNTSKILKDKFTCIDLGGNIEMHGMWSDKRDWEKSFYPSERKLRKKTDLLETWDCQSCLSINLLGVEHCEYCGEEKTNVKINGKTKKSKDGVLKSINKHPIPNGKTIVDYTKKIQKDSNFAFKLAEKKILDLFIHYKVSPDFYNDRSDRFKERIKEIYRDIYFEIIKSDLHGANKKLETMYKRLFNQIDIRYGKK